MLSPGYAPIKGRNIFENSESVNKADFYDVKYSLLHKRESSNLDFDSSVLLSRCIEKNEQVFTTEVAQIPSMSANMAKVLNLPTQSVISAIS